MRSLKRLSCNCYFRQRHANNSIQSRSQRGTKVSINQFLDVTNAKGEQIIILQSVHNKEDEDRLCRVEKLPVRMGLAKNKKGVEQLQER